MNYNIILLRARDPTLLDTKLLCYISLQLFLCCVNSFSVLCTILSRGCFALIFYSHTIMTGYFHVRGFINLEL